MKVSYDQIGVGVDLAQLVEKARDAELTRDVETLKTLLEPIWEDFRAKPDFDHIEPKIRAGLLRACGYFITTLGHSQNAKVRLGLASELVLESINIFVDLNIADEIGRGKALLGGIYIQQGRMEETEVILDEAAVFYENDQLHPVNLLISVTKVAALIWKQDYQQAIEILSNVQIPMELCEDDFLLARYHVQAGIIYSRVGRFELAKSHFEKGISHSEILNNPLYAATGYNSLALAYLREDQLPKAMETITESIRIYQGVDEKGWLANSFDTEAQIYLAADDLEKAFVSIEKAIDIFRNGKNHSGHLDALWVKIHVLLRSNRKEDAFLLFSELTELASKELGEYAVKKYADKFAKIIHVKRGTDFFGEIRAFKRDLLIESLVEANADIDKSAESLKTNRKEIIHVLNREFPDIYLELGMSPHVMSTANN